jgi:toxin ParE1/3/4
MGEIAWTERARQDLQEIVEYISRDANAYAQSFALRLRKKIDRLCSFPESGRLIPEDPGRLIREVLVENYRVLYRVAQERVVILTVIHGARNIGPPTQ